MDKLKNLQANYENYSKQAEELRHKIAELNIELEHAIFMKEAYKRSISIRAYVDTDNIKERINRNFGCYAGGFTERQNESEKSNNDIYTSE